MLFLLKIAITPFLVAAVSVAARWWGPTVGGILMGLPWFTGPTLFVLVQDKGIDFGVSACVGIELGVACVAAFILAYGLISIAARWPLCLTGGIVAFAASAWVAQHPALLAGVALGNRATLGGVGRRPGCSGDRPPSAAASDRNAGVAGAAMVGTSPCAWRPQVRSSRPSCSRPT